MAPKQTSDVEAGKGGEQKECTHWHALTKEDAAGVLGLPKNVREVGLSTPEAKQRLEQYGYNQLTEKARKTLLQKIWAQVGNILVGILVVVAVVSLVKGIITTGESRITNFIEVGLITFVIT